MQIDRMLILTLYKSSLGAEIQRKYDLRFKTFTSSEFSDGTKTLLSQAKRYSVQMLTYPEVP